MSVFEKNVGCKDVAPLLVFYACGEATYKERKQIEGHVAHCEACATQLGEERHLQEALLAAPQSADEFDASGILLSQCRSELAEALDDLSAPPIQEHWRPFFPFFGFRFSGRAAPSQCRAAHDSHWPRR